MAAPVPNWLPDVVEVMGRAVFPSEVTLEAAWALQLPDPETGELSPPMLHIRGVDKQRLRYSSVKVLRSQLETLDDAARYGLLAHVFSQIEQDLAR